MIRNLLSFIAFFLLSNLVAQLPDGFVRQQIVTGLNPTKMVLAPDGRIFIAEKNGVVLVVRDDALLPDPFLTIEVDDNNERGLAGITLDPDFENNHFIYIYYTVPGLFKNRVSRFTANGDRAVPGSERVIFELDELRSDVHNGGDMRFGMDGKLYIATGDGGYSWVSENKGSLLGKMLRINADGTIPEDNPFYNETNGKGQAVFAYGFRNPFTSAMHPITGDLYINDVGAETWEEINHVQSGKFYGWSSIEGFLNGQSAPDNYEDPVHAYHHDNGCAVVGATIYEPETYTFPEKYWGKYFFGDYCKGQVRMLNLETGEYEGIFMSGADRLIYLITHTDGSIYYLERRGLGDGSPWDNTSTTNGVLGKIFFTGSGAPFISIQPKSEFSVAGEPVSFTIEALGEATLEYQWYVNEVPVAGATSPTLQFSATSIDQDQSRIYVKVWNQLDTIQSVDAILSVTSNQRPIVTILSPEEGQTYNAGTSIAYLGTALDPENGVVPLEKVGWRIDFHHDEHTHPASALEYGFDQGTFDIPKIGEIDTNVFYRFYMLAEDQDGLTQVAQRDLKPEIIKNRIGTNPSGLLINSDGKLIESPFEMYSVKGITRTVAAPLKQVKGDSVFFFDFWAHGDRDAVIQFDAGDEAFKNGLNADYSGILAGKGNGWTASYYDNIDLVGTPVATAQDSAIDYLFHIGTPNDLLPKDFFSIRWEGFLLPYKSDQYHISLQADDGVRMWIGDEKIIDAWTGGGHFEKGEIYLEEGKLYPVRLEYFEHSYGAYIILKWVASHFGQEVLPAAQMYPKNIFDADRIAPLKLHPIPAQNELFLSTYSEERRELNVEIIDAFGRLQHQSHVLIEFGENRIPLDISQLSNGGYFLHCLDQNRNVIYESKMLVQK